MKGLLPLPPPFLGVLLRTALLSWILAHLVLAAVSLAVGAPAASPTVPSTIALVGIVTFLAWLDLRRRNLWSLLPTLGVSTGMAVGAIALMVGLAELVMAVAR